MLLVLISSVFTSNHENFAIPQGRGQTKDKQVATVYRPTLLFLITWRILGTNLAHGVIYLKLYSATNIVQANFIINLNYQVYKCLDRVSNLMFFVTLYSISFAPKSLRKHVFWLRIRMLSVRNLNPFGSRAIKILLVTYYNFMNVFRYVCSFYFLLLQVLLSNLGDCSIDCDF